MESNKTVAETSGGNGREVGNNDENIRLPEPWGVQRSTRGGRRPLPPPFLLKIYDIVDDPNTNSIISWGPNNTSFIIFDQLRFTSEVLPKYFRHGNFSSFIYQLNNYGFKKISWDKIEYENQWFQAGKKQWLEYINRRNQIPQPEITSQQASFTPPNDSKMAIVEEIEFLRAEQNNMKEEIEMLRRQRDELANKFTASQGNIKLADSKHEEIIIQLVAKKLLQNASARRGKSSTESSKRQKLTTSGCMDSEEMNISEQAAGKGGVSGQSGYEKHQDQKELTEIQTEEQILSSVNDSGSSNQDDQVNTFPGNAENCAYWKKILEDGSEHDNQEPELADQANTFPGNAENCAYWKKILEDGSEHENQEPELADQIPSDTPMPGENLITNSIFIKVEEGGHSSS